MHFQHICKIIFHLYNSNDALECYGLGFFFFFFWLISLKYIWNFTGHNLCSRNYGPNRSHLCVCLYTDVAKVY